MAGSVMALSAPAPWCLCLLTHLQFFPSSCQSSPPQGVPLHLSPSCYHRPPLYGQLNNPNKQFSRILFLFSPSLRKSPQMNCNANVVGQGMRNLSPGLWGGKMEVGKPRATWA